MQVGFESLLKNIQLTPDQQKDAQDKFRQVGETLHSMFYTSDYDGATSVMVGSYAKCTVCHPPTNIDLLFALPRTLLEKYQPPTCSDTNKLLEDVEQSLQQKFQQTQMRGDGRAVTVQFDQGACVDVIPAFHSRSSPGIYIIPDHRFHICWQTTNPEAELAYLTSVNQRSRGKATQLIQMMRAWKANCAVPIKSFALELMVCEFLPRWKGDSTPGSMVREFLGYLLRRQNRSRLIPGIVEFYDYGDDWGQEAKTAYETAVYACEYASKNEAFSEVIMHTQWQKIFGPAFPGIVTETGSDNLS